MIIDEILGQLRGATVASRRTTSRGRPLSPGARVLLNTDWYRPRAGGLRRLRRGPR